MRVVANKQPPTDPRRILLWLEHGLGDHIMAQRLSRAIRTRWPQARIVAAAIRPLLPFANHSPRFDDVMSISRNSNGESRADPAMIKTFDLAVDLRAGGSLCSVQAVNPVPV